MKSVLVAQISIEEDDLKALIKEDSRQSTRDLADILPVSPATVLRGLRDLGKSYLKSSTMLTCWPFMTIESFGEKTDD